MEKPSWVQLKLPVELCSIANVKLLNFGMSARPAAQRMAAAKSLLPKVSGEIKAVLPEALSLKGPSKASSAIVPKIRTGSGREIISEHNFVPVVKGSVVPPGELGFTDIVPTGNRQAFNQAFETPSSYWWNLGGDNPKDIHSIAFGSIKYTSPGGLQQAGATAEQAQQYGMTVPEMRGAIENIMHRKDQNKVAGKIVFSRAPKINSSYYSGGGEDWMEAVQVADPVVPMIKMDIPSNLKYEYPSQFKIIDEKTGKVIDSFRHAENLKQIEFHDFMKQFSENVKAVAPEGAALPPGTQRYLNLPYRKDANQALQRYLAEKYPERKFSDAVVESFDTSTKLNEDGAERFPVSLYDADAKKRVKGSIKPEDLFRFLNS